MTARLLALVALVVVALLGGDARAQSASDRAKAAEHSRQGLAYFKSGDFDRAIAEYQTAFDLSAEPDLIFNIALCHDRAGRPIPALQGFRRYLELAPSGIAADEARIDIARLTPIVEKLLSERAAEEARQHDEAERKAEAARREAAAQEEDRARTRRMRLGIYLMIGGGAVAAAGGVTYLVAWRTSDRLGGPSDVEPFISDSQRFRLEQKLAYGGFALGGAVVAAGLIVAYTARGRSDRPQISAAIVPGGAAITVAWSR
jgi:tetratricopeptide (TPR) repeat protein